MNNKKIGVIIGILGLLLSASIFLMIQKDDQEIDIFVEDKGSCFLDDGTCLHQDRDYTLFNFGWILSAGMIILAFYLIFVDKTNEKIEENKKKIEEAIKETKDDKFEIFLSAFDDDNKLILKTIKKNEGITQSTLRFKTGLSKAHLSNLVNILEGKEFISRKARGKTYEIYLRERN